MLSLEDYAVLPRGPMSGYQGRLPGPGDRGDLSQGQMLSLEEHGVLSRRFMSGNRDPLRGPVDSLSLLLGPPLDPAKLGQQLHGDRLPMPGYLESLPVPGNRGGLRGAMSFPEDRVSMSGNQGPILGSHRPSQHIPEDRGCFSITRGPISGPRRPSPERLAPGLIPGHQWLRALGPISLARDPISLPRDPMKNFRGPLSAPHKRSYEDLEERGKNYLHRGAVTFRQESPSGPAPSGPPPFAGRTSSAYQGGMSSELQGPYPDREGQPSLQHGLLSSHQRRLSPPQEPLPTYREQTSVSQGPLSTHKGHSSKPRADLFVLKGSLIEEAPSAPRGSVPSPQRPLSTPSSVDTFVPQERLSFHQGPRSTPSFPRAQLPDSQKPPRGSISPRGSSSTTAHQGPRATVDKSVPLPNRQFSASSSYAQQESISTRRGPPSAPVLREYVFDHCGSPSASCPSVLRGSVSTDKGPVYQTDFQHSEPVRIGGHMDLASVAPIKIKHDVTAPEGRVEKPVGHYRRHFRSRTPSPWSPQRQSRDNRNKSPHATPPKYWSPKWRVRGSRSRSPYSASTRNQSPRRLARATRSPYSINSRNRSPQRRARSRSPHSNAPRYYSPQRRSRRSRSPRSAMHKSQSPQRLTRGIGSRSPHSTVPWYRSPQAHARGVTSPLPHSSQSRTRSPGSRIVHRRSRSPPSPLARIRMRSRSPLPLAYKTRNPSPQRKTSKGRSRSKNRSPQASSSRIKRRSPCSSPSKKWSPHRKAEYSKGRSPRRSLPRSHSSDRTAKKSKGQSPLSKKQSAANGSTCYKNASHARSSSRNRSPQRTRAQSRGRSPHLSLSKSQSSKTETKRNKSRSPHVSLSRNRSPQRLAISTRRKSPHISGNQSPQRAESIKGQAMAERTRGRSPHSSLSGKQPPEKTRPNKGRLPHSLPSRNRSPQLEVKLSPQTGVRHSKSLSPSKSQSRTGVERSQSLPPHPLLSQNQPLQARSKSLSPFRNNSSQMAVSSDCGSHLFLFGNQSAQREIDQQQSPGSSCENLAECAPSPESGQSEQRFGVRIQPFESTRYNRDISYAMFRIFKKFGFVISIEIHGKGESRYCLVLYGKYGDQQKAMSATQNLCLWDRPVDVSSWDGFETESKTVFRPGEKNKEFNQRATKTLVVNNLDNSVSRGDLHHCFQPFGKILEINMKRKLYDDGGFAFIQFSDMSSCVGAFKGMNGLSIGNCILQLTFGKSLPTKCVWLDGITSIFTESYLVKVFGQYGPVAQVALDYVNCKALVFFFEVDHAEVAVKAVKMKKLCGVDLKVDFANRACQLDFYRVMNSTDQNTVSLYKFLMRNADL